MEASNEWGRDAHLPHRSSFRIPVGNVGGNRRRQQAVQVGKERREALVRRKRLRRDEAVGDGDIDLIVGDDDGGTKEAKTLAAVQELQEAGKAMEAYASPTMTEALRNVRKLLSCNAVPPLKAAVEAGVVSILVDILKFGTTEDQFLEAAWCLTNIASGEQELTKAVLPALPLLIAHLGDSEHVAAVVEQCAWAIGNVAGESPEMRSILLAQRALAPLGRLLTSPVPSVARTAAWAMSNLIKGPHSTAASELMGMEGIPEYLVELIAGRDEELVVEVGWILVYVTSMADINSQILEEIGVLRPLAGLVATSNQSTVLIPVLRCINNVVSGDNSRTDAVLAACANVPGGLIGGLRRCLEMGERALQKESAMTVSSIAAGTMFHKQVVFQGGTIPSLLHLLATAAFDVRKEAAYALGNVCVTSNGVSVDPIVEHLTVLVDRGCIPGFLALVKSPDMEAATLGLQFLELVMRGLPEGQGPKVVEKEDGIAAMEVLQFHENDELRNLANGLVDKYFGEDYGLEEECGPDILDTGGPVHYNFEYPPWRRHGAEKGH